MDESNGFNISLLEKGKGFIEFEVVLSDETLDMINKKQLDRKSFEEVNWTPISLKRDLLKFDI